MSLVFRFHRKSFFPKSFCWADKMSWQNVFSLPAWTCSFANLGIQCVRRKELDSSLQKRRKQNIDPFHSELDPNTHLVRHSCTFITIYLISEVSYSLLFRLKLVVDAWKHRSRLILFSLFSLSAGQTKGIEDMDMNAVRLCFQCELEWEDDRKDSLSPVVSSPIYDKSKTLPVTHKNVSPTM